MININHEIEKLDWGKEPRGLYEPIGYTLAAGGKRLRPQLALMGCRIAGGQESDALHAALALEIFHNFTLLHDDLMDNAAVRRDRPTVHVQWGANTAILSGDQMMIEAYKELSLLPADKLPRVLQLFCQMATEICEGQQLDMDFEQRDDVCIADYMEMIRLKTSVLLATALQIGAYIGGADQATQDRLYRIGIAVGLAFQIQDDILDVYGDPKTFGKAIGGDILDNKKTYMLLSALSAAGDDERAALQHWLSTRERTQDKIDAVRAIYDRVGARRACEEEMERQLQQALTLIDELPDTPDTQALRAMALKLQSRKS